MKNNLRKPVLFPVMMLLIVALLLPLTAVYAGDNDNRLNPDHGEYYTVYCVNDNVDLYLANGHLVNRVLVARVIGLSSEGGSIGIGEGMIATRWHDAVTVAGHNGNAAPAGGTKTFSLRQCLDVNGNTPNAIFPNTGTTTTSWTGSTGSASVVIPPAGTCAYLVQPGETVYSIAKRYNTSVYAISVLNHLIPSRIYAGQYLTIPGCDTRPTQHRVTWSQSAPIRVGDGQTHVLLSGQTLYSVARAYHVSVSALMNANGISDPTRLPAGMVLNIP